ncbi:MAG: tetratricopeptide repeat protein [Desulfobacterales bacterium]|nr:tetratricopeptide repeat protein [Desulfobacterales bacterium]
MKLKIILIITIIFSFTHNAFSYLIINPEKQLEFADYLFSKGDYPMAINEYKRFIYFFPEDQKIESAIFKIGMAYFKTKKYEYSINHFREHINQFPDINLSLKSYFMISDSYQKLNDYSSATSVLSDIFSITDDPNINDKTNYKIGWLYLEMNMFENAKQSFIKISESNYRQYQIDKIFLELPKEGYLPKKNPVIAGSLSIVPGLGYIYCERYYDALTSFILNGILFFASYESFKNDSPALGIFAGLVGFGFYTGSIYGSISSAYKYNELQKNNFFKSLKNLQINLSYNEKKINALFTYKF